jgi:Ca-activated chloride channel family protein
VSGVMILPKDSPYRISLVCLITVLLVICPASAGQDDKPIKLQTDLVMVDVTVTDKDGKFIRSLIPEDFTIYEDDQPQKVDFFNANEEAALTRSLAVVVAIDTSGSIKPEEIVRQREATESFMRLVRPDSLFAIMAFNSETRVLQDFTSDPKKISQAFQRLGEVGGSSKIFGSIDRAISMRKRAPRFRNGRRLRRVVIVLTDGYDNVSPPEQSDMIQRANDAAVTVYSITLPSYMAGAGANQRIMTLLDVSRVVPLTGGKDFSADAKTSRRCLRRLPKRSGRATRWRTIPRKRVVTTAALTRSESSVSITGQLFEPIVTPIWHRDEGIIKRDG